MAVTWIIKLYIYSDIRFFEDDWIFLYLRFVIGEISLNILFPTQQIIIWGWSWSMKIRYGSPEINRNHFKLILRLSQSLNFEWSCLFCLLNLALASDVFPFCSRAFSIRVFIILAWHVRYNFLHIVKKRIPMPQKN